MKRLFLIIIACAMACMPLRAQSGAGTACDDAIRLTEDYAAEIRVPTDVWYTANTFDLPLAVYFIPNDWDRGEAQTKPTVEMDFTCTPGVYEDSILCSLFCRTSATAVMFEMPHKPALKKDVLADGRDCYALKMGTECRDLLFQAGVTNNVPVFIKVHYPAPGYMSMAPDNMFASCMDDGEWLRMGHTYHITPSETDTFFVAPFTHWQNDSVQFSWSGSEPMELYIGGVCDFDPDNGDDDRILDIKTIEAGGKFKYQSQEIKYYMTQYKDASEAGLFYAKVRSASEGDLKVERVPAAPVDGGAKLLKYNTQVPIGTDPQVTYAISRSWLDATRFVSPTALDVQMHVSANAHFADTLCSYTFSPSMEGHELCFKTEEMKDLWNKTTRNYLYLRFDCPSRTMLKAEYWTPGSCEQECEYIAYNGSTLVQVSSSDFGFRRINLNDWLGGSMTISKSTSSNVELYVGDTCKFQMPNKGGDPSPSETHIHAYYLMKKSAPEVNLTAEQLSEWQQWADADNNVYLRIYYASGSRFTLSFAGTRHTNQPQLEPAPAEGLATIAVRCNEEGRLVVTVGYCQELTLYGPNTLPVIPSWIQQRDEEHLLPADLAPGTYTLRGGRDEVIITVK